MSDIVNTQQSEAWNGYEGQHWAAHQSRYDAVNSGFNHHLLDAVRDGDRVLDLGCGNGQTTRLAATRTPSGHALGVDLSAPMLERARVTATDEGLTNVTFEQGDAQVHPFPAGEFDLAVSRFGVMFYADPVAAFTNIARALAPGGGIAFLSRADVASSDLGPVLDAVGQQLPDTEQSVPNKSGGPLSLSSPDRIREVLGAGGFARVQPTYVEATQVWGRDVEDAASFLADWGPVRFRLDQAESADAARARAALVDALRPYEGPEGVRLRGTAWLTTARRA